ncbi:hypothetical protein Tco_0004819 [Tanacetum coccineum]
MKVEESLNVTFDETPSPPKTSPLEDDDLVEEEAIEIEDAGLSTFYLRLRNPRMASRMFLMIDSNLVNILIQLECLIEDEDFVKRLRSTHNQLYEFGVTWIVQDIRHKFGYSTSTSSLLY